MPKKTAIGVVTSDSMAKTRRVEIPRLVKHPKYGKYVRSRTICYMHDEQGESGLGDITASLFFSPKAPTSRGWIWGAGPVALLPTASEDALGSEQWGL